MNLLTLNDLITHKVHIGHYWSYWDSRCTKFIYKIINNIWIIDLIHTSKALWKAYIFMYKSSLYNQKILFIGSSRYSKNIIKKTALLTNQFYITDTIKPGLFTNWEVIRGNILLLIWLKQVLFLIQHSYVFGTINHTFKDTLFKLYTKLHYKLKNIITFQTIPQILFISDLNTHTLLVKESITLNKILLSIIDTNWNPTDIHIAIPGNDDNLFSVKLICQIITTALIHGLLKRQQYQF
uniref:30S ribosomal protein S2 n=1 Tax=Nephromyces sp. ex Molgula occidentalis TaxID=2544991 RepID=A0A5C1H812_9APIC|nr:30S ribosomal protein S2 [Nephromyces sp. ex Molgula occidentalis]